MPFDATDYVPATVDPRTLETPRERLIYLRDFLRELPPERFDMSGIGRFEESGTGHCNTPACIGGWGRALFGRRSGGVGGIDWVGQESLGLTCDQTYDLFYPCGFMSAAPAQAAAVLTHLIETGEVDWSVA